MLDDACRYALLPAPYDATLIRLRRATRCLRYADRVVRRRRLRLMSRFADAEGRCHACWRALFFCAMSPLPPAYAPFLPIFSARHAICYARARLRRHERHTKRARRFAVVIRHAIILRAALLIECLKRCRHATPLILPR